MKKYALVINEETKQCAVGIGSNTEFYRSMGMIEQEVEQAYDGKWYLKGYVPEYKPTDEEQRALRARAYEGEVDPITAHIQRLRDEEGTEDEIAELIKERALKVEEIKQRYPYSEGENETI